MVFFLFGILRINFSGATMKKSMHHILETDSVCISEKQIQEKKQLPMSDKERLARAMENVNTNICYCGKHYVCMSELFYL